MTNSVETTIDCLLFCPYCKQQHIDRPDPSSNWNNPPHRVHQCEFCGARWAASPLNTNGVARNAIPVSTKERGPQHFPNPHHVSYQGPNVWGPNGIPQEVIAYEGGDGGGSAFIGGGGAFNISDSCEMLGGQGLPCGCHCQRCCCHSSILIGEHDE